LAEAGSFVLIVSAKIRLLDSFDGAFQFASPFLAMVEPDCIKPVVVVTFPGLA